MPIDTRQSKIWINRIYNSDDVGRYPLSKKFALTEHTQANQIAFDLSRTPIKSSKVASGDTVYIAVQGKLILTNGKLLRTTRIVAKGIVNAISYPNGVPQITFVPNTFEYIDTPLINGLDLKLFANHRGIKVASRYPYFSISKSDADFIDESIFYQTLKK